MKTDDDDNAPGFETVIQDRSQRGFELFELVIDRDPQGLKDARGGMTFPRQLRPACHRLLARAASRHCLGQVAGSPNRLSRSPFDEIPGHPAGFGFFSELLEDVAEFLFAKAHDQVGGRFALSRVEPQIERAVGREAEAPGAIGQLVGRQPQVEQNAIDRGDVDVRQDPGEISITGLMEVAGKARELKGRNFQHPGVPVKTDQRPLRPDPPQNLATVAGRADRAIDHDEPRLEM